MSSTFKQKRRHPRDSHSMRDRRRSPNKAALSKENAAVQIDGCSPERQILDLRQAFSFFLASGYESARSNVSWLNWVISLYSFCAFAVSPLFS